MIMLIKNNPLEENIYPFEKSSASIPFTKIYVPYGSPAVGKYSFG